VSTLALALVYGLGGWFALNGGLDAGSVVALALLLTRLYGPLTALANAPMDIVTAIVSFERVFEVLDLEPLISDAPDAVDIPEGPATIDALLRQNGAEGRAIDDSPLRARPLLWSRYRLTAELGSWLLAFVSVAERLSISICVSDMSTAGNPLIFINKAFMEMTGYSRADTYGRNCRLLQGPETSVAAVQSLKHQSSV
jgi:ABC-type multidrug transport system fused ATPase/permease subunit